MPPAARVVRVAEQAVLASAAGGAAAAVAEVTRRAGGHLGPDVAAAFTDAGAMVPVGTVPELCALPARFVDLESRWLIGHSEHLARLAEGAGRLAGLAGLAED
ncbi:hypothetical protein AB0G32_13350 [Streptomyces sp. NPDC023723]|uniref:hypothetical protein n=1 Tax=Streptomyces sp. NPDC023723 TaxID=3154323 RepID=UPI00340A8307